MANMIRLPTVVCGLHSTANTDTLLAVNVRQSGRRSGLETAQ